jgi:hypothetical protein
VLYRGRLVYRHTAEWSSGSQATRTSWACCAFKYNINRKSPKALHWWLSILVVLLWSFASLGREFKIHPAHGFLILSLYTDRWPRLYCKAPPRSHVREKIYMDVCAKFTMPRVSSRMTWYLFAPSIQFVVPRVHGLQDVVLKCTFNTSCGTRSVYDSSCFSAHPPPNSEG